MNEFDNDLEMNTAAMKRLMRWFTLSSLTLVFGVGGWAVAATVESAVVAGGTFVVQSSAQAVQHLEGGVVGAILVKDGQHVQEETGAAFASMPPVTTDTSIIERKSIDLLAEKASPRNRATRRRPDPVPTSGGGQSAIRGGPQLALEAQQTSSSRSARRAPASCRSSPRQKPRSKHSSSGSRSSSMP